MLISPDEVKTKAKSKENENYAFRTYLKMHADPRMKNYFPDMTAVNAAIAAKCIAA